jgi:hypothetical protein
MERRHDGARMATHQDRHGAARGFADSVMLRRFCSRKQAAFGGDLRGKNGSTMDSYRKRGVAGADAAVRAVRVLDPAERRQEGAAPFGQSKRGRGDRATARQAPPVALSPIFCTRKLARNLRKIQENSWS